MLQYLLDTGIVSNPISKTPNSGILAQLKEHGQESAIAGPVWHELIYGCRRLVKGKRRNAIEQYLYDVVQASFLILPYDEIAATWHGDERARLESIGKTAPFTDGQIAAIAHANDLVLVTLNDKDFARFKGLRVTNWSKARDRGPDSAG